MNRVLFVVPDVVIRIRRLGDRIGAIVTLRETEEQIRNLGIDAHLRRIFPLLWASQEKRRDYFERQLDDDSVIGRRGGQPTSLRPTPNRLPRESNAAHL